MIRHGQTDFNLKGVVQGRGIDSSLNEVGRQQAERFFQQYKSVIFDKIYISSLRRTRQTVQGFIDSGIAYTPLSGLDEIHWGSKEGKPFDARDHQEYQEVTNQWSKGNTDVRIAGGESPDQVFVRQQESLEHIMSNHHEKTVLICMHGRALRIFICLLLNYPLKYMNLFPHNNTGLYNITYSGSYFRLDRVNSIYHLNSNGNANR
ncbi:MAG: phosphoglycerate mutase [Cyclobacteriaceae bacterium]|nr:MAG: phosphoglycerate mutase [Cyclobacteriaceae bacterium]